eukprot:TRINITY_DN3232_c0_g1_i10.p3 TRINITY_DN3232_c0_g1~~TRINITY_DN3232_c0_g1_i10.p3  ORF type:complete len:356 (+),score=46.41 TRINITY_DN3232_c0_g1_i10:2011-3078(+)
MNNNIIAYFKENGMINPKRSINLIYKAIEFTKLNLNGLTVFTEAASGEFIYTPIIAALGRAKKVYAITKDSKYAAKDDVKKKTMLFAELCGAKDNINVVFDKSNINEADIITNLGFVRPINKTTIDMMKENAVIPYMCETWELRNEDIDIEYCKEKGINVMGTNENYPGLDIFNFSGALAMKMIFDSGIEIYKTKIVIVSNDNFGDVIYSALIKLSPNVVLLKDLNEQNYDMLKNTETLIIADYTSNKCFIGKHNSKISAKKLKELSNFITVIQFAGKVDIDDLKENNINFYPDYKVGNHRMGKTLAYLGPKPIIDLHCAGLKVGEIMYRNSKKHIKNKLCQEFLQHTIKKMEAR